MAAPRYTGPRIGEPEPDRTRKLQRIFQGKLNNSTNGTFTLTANSTTTTLTDHLITETSTIAWHPTTAQAANEATALYVSAQTNGSATLTHDSRSGTDRTFRYCVFG